MDAAMDVIPFPNSGSDMVLCNTNDGAIAVQSPFEDTAGLENAMQELADAMVGD